MRNQFWRAFVSVLILVGFWGEANSQEVCNVGGTFRFCQPINIGDWGYKSVRCDEPVGPFSSELEAIQVGVQYNYRPSNCAGQWTWKAEKDTDDGWGGPGACGSSNYYPEFYWGVESRNTKTILAQYSVTSNDECVSAEDGLTVYRERDINCPVGTSPTWMADRNQMMCVNPSKTVDCTIDLATNRCLQPELSCSADGQSVGQPILPGTAEKYRSETDWTDGGASPLEFVRTYRSTWSWDATRRNGVLGQVWSHSYAIRLIATPAISPATALITFGDGYSRSFVKAAGSNVWESANSSDTLTQAVSGGWVYRQSASGATFNFGESGKLESHSDRAGRVTLYSYNSAGQLATVTNSFARVLTFSYANNKLASIQTPDGRVISYGYDSVGRLAAVTYPDSTTRTFAYENSAYPQALTGIVDESGVRWGTFTYDTQGRAVGTQLAGGVSNFQVSYPTTGAATVVDPLGTSRTYHYSTNKGKLAVVSGSLAGNGAHSAAASRVQDANGLVTSETDFNGVVTKTTWDAARRLPLAIEQAIGTPDARTTSISWHPQFDLKTSIVEAGRTTSLGYDGHGNLLTRTFTDTAAVPNTSSTWTYAYNAQQLVSSQTDPSGSVTQYEYDSRGNLLLMRNPLGQVTNYEYDNSNRLVKSTEPNGVVSIYTWDGRDRILSTQIGAQSATVLTYNPTGTLATFTSPSGQALIYSYDAAHRLVGWSSNRGESGIYVLDTAGNRLSEQRKDSVGAVAWELTREINNINRVAKESSVSTQDVTYGYDLNGELVSQSNGLSQTTSFGLDRIRRIQRITNAAGAQATLQYNPLDAIIQAKDFKGISTNYTRDALGNAPQESTPDAGTSQSTFDARGQLASSPAPQTPQAALSVSSAMR